MQDVEIYLHIIFLLDLIRFLWVKCLKSIQRLREIFSITSFYLSFCVYFAFSPFNTSSIPGFNTLTWKSAKNAIDSSSQIWNPFIFCGVNPSDNMHLFPTPFFSSISHFYLSNQLLILGFDIVTWKSAKNAIGSSGQIENPFIFFWGRPSGQSGNFGIHSYISNPVPEYGLLFF